MIKSVPVFLIILFNLSYSQSSQSFFSPQNRLKFGDYLYCQKDYLRAFDEYRQYLKFEHNDTLLFKMGLALREMGRFSEAEDYFSNLSFNSAFAARSRKEYFKTLFISGDYTKLKEETVSNRFTPYDKNFLNSLNMSAILLWENRLPDSTGFANSFQPDLRPKMIELFMRKKYPDYKDQLTAGILSGIVPGLGKIYNGDYGDGITAFLFTTVLGYLAYDNFKADHNFRAWLFTGLTAIFHAGNIYGSVASAQMHNAEYDLLLQREIKKIVESENYFDSEKPDFCK
ncbi:MAG: tetratricopeptide repeat protein [Ignavibacteria bacterium]|nr:MAG: tetratricopeptide repeat protein [Ignavibacteria bacterium]